MMKIYRLDCRGKILQLDTQPIVMGILNVTPDSFSDGGQYLDPSAAVGRALEMVEHGARIIDVGGQSTRPGAQAVSDEEQIKRVVPVIERIFAEADCVISIDTTSSNVANAALEAGAGIINDISACQLDDRMAALAAETDTPVILMHMQGTPSTMQDNPTYLDVIAEVKAFLAERIALAVDAGIKPSQIVVDPGIGFGKTLAHNLLIMKYLEKFHGLDVPVLVGPSRKAFIGKVLAIDEPAERLWGTAAAVARCVAAGVQIIRVHDVKQMYEVAQMAAAIRNGP